MPKTQIVTASSQKGKKSVGCFYQFTVYHEKGRGGGRKKEEKDRLDMVEIAHPMSYFKKKDPGMNA